MTMDNRTRAGMEQVGFSQTRQTWRSPRSEHREVFGKSHEGWSRMLLVVVVVVVVVGGGEHSTTHEFCLIHRDIKGRGTCIWKATDSSERTRAAVQVQHCFFLGALPVEV